MRGAPQYETFPVIKVEPGLSYPQKRTRKHKQRKLGMPRSRYPAQKEKKRRGRPRKVKKLVLVSDGNGMWAVKRKRRSGRGQNVRRKTLPHGVTERSRSKSFRSSKNIKSATLEWSHCNPIDGGILLDGDNQTRTPTKAAIKRSKNKCSPVPCNTQERNSLTNTNVYERLQPENDHYNQINEGILLDEDNLSIIPTKAANKRSRNKCSRVPCNTQERNFLTNTDVYERLQPENGHISTTDCSLTNNIDAYVAARPDDNDADPDVVIVEEVDEVDPTVAIVEEEVDEAEPDVMVVEEVDEAEPDVMVVEEVDEAEPDVMVVEEVTNQKLGQEWCADRGSDVAFNLSDPSQVRTEEFVDTYCSREHVPLEVPERIPDTYLGDPDARGIEQMERQQLHQLSLPADQWEQQPTRRSPTDADYEMLNKTLSQVPQFQGQQIQKQRILEEVLEMNHIQFPRVSPQPHDLVPSNYRWHQPQALPERCQNQSRPPCQCGSAHETAVDRLAMTMLQDSRLVLSEERAEKQKRVGNASQFLKTFHGVHSECEEPALHETMFQDPEAPCRQHCQYPTARQEFSEEYQFQHSYRTVKTEEYQFQHSSRTVKTIVTNSIPSQRYMAAQSVAVDRQVIYKEEYKIIPQTQLDWNISDGCILSDINLDLNLSRGTLVSVSP